MGSFADSCVSLDFLSVEKWGPPGGWEAVVPGLSFSDSPGRAPKVTMNS